MKSRVDTGAIRNKGASAALSRPGNSTAEKIKAFSEPGDDFPQLSSLPVQKTIPVLNIQEGQPMSRYRTVKEVKTTGYSKCEDANEIDQYVFIGNSNSAKDLDWFRNNNIGYVVNTAAEIPNFFPDQGIRYFNLRLYDNPKQGDEDLLGLLEPTYRYISAVIKFNPLAKILVHCHMGKSRSASVVIYYLMRSRGWRYQDALEFVRSKRPIVAPNMWYARQLQDAEILLNR